LKYIGGRYFWDKRTAKDFEKAIDDFKQAIDLEPTYALAYSGLADCYVLLPFYGYVQSKDAVPRAIEAALKALEIDDSVAEAHASLAYAKFIYDWDWTGAEFELKRSLTLNNNYPTAHHWYADYLAAMGRTQEAIPEMRRARDLDPLSLMMNTDLGWVLYSAGKYDEAVEQLKNTLEIGPDFKAAHWTLGNVYMAKAMYSEAVAEFERQNDRALLGCALAGCGRRAAAVEILRELTRASGPPATPRLSIALLYCWLGDRQSAIEWLQRAIEAREQRVVYLKFDHVADALRSDPRFVSLLQRIGLG
jgi:tetratricopeptide (TPR) repeat protein